MDLPVRPLTEARIRELLDGMPAFNDRVRKLGRTKAGRSPLPLPAPENYPAVGSLADAIASSFSDDPDEVAFFRDVTRLQELWTYVGVLPGSARNWVNQAIASLRQQTDQIVGTASAAGMADVLGAMVSARIAQLESITDEELQAVERHASAIGPAMMSGLAKPRRPRRR